MSTTSTPTIGPQPGEQAITGGICAAEHAVANAAAARFLTRHAGHDAGLPAAVASGIQVLTQGAVAETAACSAPREDYHRREGGGGHMFY